MQKGKNANQDTKQDRRRRTTPSERTTFIFLGKSSNREPGEKTTFKSNGTFYNYKQTGQLHQKGRIQDLE
jgi:hypothetical protein